MPDRVEPSIYKKPCSYGFIPQTLDEDGDELDTLIVCDEPLPTGIWLEARIVGVMNFVDDGDNDHKIVVVPADDRNTGDSIKTLADLGERWQQIGSLNIRQDFGQQYADAAPFLHLAMLDRVL
jgi:inorganic pyrophosphatase